MALKILVCGSRDWTDAEQLEDVLAEYELIHRKNVHLVHGAAKGADKIAANFATKLGWSVKPFPADWDKYGRLAGPKRNLEMLDEKPDLVLAFQVGKSRGTQHTINHARKRGIPVKVYNG